MTTKAEAEKLNTGEDLRFFGEGSLVRPIGYGYTESGKPYESWQLYDPEPAVTTPSTSKRSQNYGYVGSADKVTTVKTSPSTTTQTSTWTPTGTRPTLGPAATINLPSAPVMPGFEAPKMGDMPTYAAPEWDESRIESLTQTKAAAGTRSLRDAVQASIASSRGVSDNPNVQRMTLKSALAGYGTGLESVMSGAATAAENQYAREYSVKADEAKTNYNTAIQTIRDVYSGELTAASADFSAKVKVVEMVYGAEQAKAIQEAATQNQRTMVEYESLLNDYFKTGETKTVAETTGGTKTQTTGPSSSGDTTGWRNTSVGSRTYEQSLEAAQAYSKAVSGGVYGFQLANMGIY